MCHVPLTDASRRLNRGEVVAVPTETVYGLAARFDDPAAIRLVFETKLRPLFDPLIVHVAKLEDAVALSSAWTPAHTALTEAFWPGPLTLVVPKAAAVSDLISSGLDTVGLRCPRHPLTLELLKTVPPLAAPSANLFGRTSPTTAAHVVSEFGGRVPVLDGGACEVGVESTVARVFDHEVQILRPGVVSAGEIKAALTRSGLARPVVRRASARSPGHAEVHYRPANPVVALDDVVNFDEQRRRAEALTGFPSVQSLDLTAPPVLVARTLYADLRRLSLTPGVIVWDRRAIRDEPGWEAILDRLNRATAAVWT